MAATPILSSVSVEVVPTPHTRDIGTLRRLQCRQQREMGGHHLGGCHFGPATLFRDQQVLCTDRVQLGSQPQRMAKQRSDLPERVGTEPVAQESTLGIVTKILCEETIDRGV